MTMTIWWGMMPDDACMICCWLCSNNAWCTKLVQKSFWPGRLVQQETSKITVIHFWPGTPQQAFRFKTCLDHFSLACLTLTWHACWSVPFQKLLKHFSLAGLLLNKLAGSKAFEPTWFIMHYCCIVNNIIMHASSCIIPHHHHHHRHHHLPGQRLAPLLRSLARL